MNKKGAELSLNVVIIAALVLIVLIVLTIIFARSAGKLNTGLADCENKGGDCVVDTPECDQLGGFVDRTKSCGEDSQDLCCIGVLDDNS